MKTATTFKKERKNGGEVLIKFSKEEREQLVFITHATGTTVSEVFRNYGREYIKENLERAKKEAMEKALGMKLKSEAE